MVQMVQDDKIAKYSHPPSVHTTKNARLQNEQPYVQSCPPNRASKITKLAQSGPFGDPPKIDKICKNEQDDHDGQSLGPKECASFPSTT